MIELAIAGNEAFAVSRYETDRGGVNYTVETLGHFQEENPGSELFFLLGADMLRDLPHWRDPGRVCQLAVPVAVGRAGHPPLDFTPLAAFTTPERLELIRTNQVQMPEIGISGTDIRRRVSAGLSIRYLTPRAVEAYIESHGLYAKDEG
jgi:nicotinate-nucleotide adenylyltransferase